MRVDIAEDAAPQQPFAAAPAAPEAEAETAAEPGPDRGAERTPAPETSPGLACAAAGPGSVVLVDGVDVPPGVAAESGCRHGTAWYARRMAVHLLARLVDRPDRTPVQCLGDAIAETAALHGARCDLSRPHTPAASVLAARLRGPVVEYLALGDAVLLLDLPGGVRVVGADQPFPAGEPLRRALCAAEPGSPEHAALRLRYARARGEARNGPAGPWAAAARPSAAEHATAGRVPRDQLRAIAALGTGARRFLDPLQLGGTGEALTLLSAAGPAELIRRVRAAEAHDPRCRRHPRESVHADAAALHATGW